ncbi:hypothetical protein BBJ28_00026730 [Nothophytophthora sp. Chile5]|nr:hypothetical protein BBJ28_00026730 [Nothophytophthora sp. Chile5]
MKDLGVNTIRLYSVDPSVSHDKFMCACSEAGIYVLVGISAPYVASGLAWMWKYGVGYFQPDDCDHEKVECVFTPYPEYDNLKTAYITTKASTVDHDSYTPERSTILSCPKNMSIALPPTPSGTVTTFCIVNAVEGCSLALWFWMGDCSHRSGVAMIHLPSPQREAVRNARPYWSLLQQLSCFGTRSAKEPVK